MQKWFMSLYSEREELVMCLVLEHPQEKYWCRCATCMKVLVLHVCHLHDSTGTACLIIVCYDGNICGTVNNQPVFETDIPLR